MTKIGQIFTGLLCVSYNWGYFCGIFCIAW